MADSTIMHTYTVKLTGEGTTIHNADHRIHALSIQVHGEFVYFYASQEGTSPSDAVAMIRITNIVSIEREDSSGTSIGREIIAPEKYGGEPFDLRDPLAERAAGRI